MRFNRICNTILSSVLVFALIGCGNGRDVDVDTGAFGQTRTPAISQGIGGNADEDFNNIESTQAPQGVPESTEATGNAKVDFSGLSPEVELATGDQAIDSLLRSVSPPKSRFTRVEERSAGMSALYTLPELKEWYDGKLSELGFIDTMPDEDRAEKQHADSGQYTYWGMINEQEILISLTARESMDGEPYCIVTFTIPNY